MTIPTWKAARIAARDVTQPRAHRRGEVPGAEHKRSTSSCKGPFRAAGSGAGLPSLCCRLDASRSQPSPNAPRGTLTRLPCLLPSTLDLCRSLIDSTRSLCREGKQKHSIRQPGVGAFSSKPHATPAHPGGLRVGISHCSAPAHAGVGALRPQGMLCTLWIPALSIPGDVATDVGVLGEKCALLPTFF